jgi:glycosyltransferase involved in cell wall biosynthesis
LKLHIVHTESSLGWGGQEIRILTEARGMAGRGHRLTLIAPRESRIFPASKDFGVDCIPLPIARKGLRGLFALKAWFAANRPDVVNTHSSTDSWLTALSCQAPIVRTRHISAPVGANPWNRWLYGSAVRRVVTTGESLRQQLISNLGLNQNHVVSIPTGIDLKRFTNAKKADLGIPEGAFVFGIVATLRSWKGHQFLLDAFSSISSKGNFHLVIVGDGPQRPLIEERITSERIHLLGQREDVPEVLAALDCFVLPSYANEGVPQAVMQAMAMGLPVISTRVGAIDEAVIEGETGVLVPPKDAQALAAAMLDMAGSPEKAKTLGEKGRIIAGRKFSIEKMIDAMELVFQSVAR